MANTKISALPANNNPTGNEELVYAYNNANGKMTLDTMKTFANTGQQAALVSGVNIKTINNTSILGSGNIDVSGGGGGGGFEPTELGGDANIWELSEGVYTTVYDLYYKTGEKVDVYSAVGGTKKQMLFIVEESTGEKGFFVYNVGHKNTAVGSYASYGYSTSSTVGKCYELKNYDWCLKRYNTSSSYGVVPLNSSSLTQIVHVVSGVNTLSVSQDSDNPAYTGLTYTIYIEESDTDYDVVVGTGVTNPLNITLPNNTPLSKKCVITLLATSATTAIVTGCTIQN